MQPNTDLSKNSKHLDACSQTSQDAEIIRQRKTHVDRNLAIATTLVLPPIHPPLNITIHSSAICFSGGIPANHVKPRRRRFGTHRF